MSLTSFWHADPDTSSWIPRDKATFTKGIFKLQSGLTLPQFHLSKQVTRAGLHPVGKEKTSEGCDYSKGRIIEFITAIVYLKPHPQQMGLQSRWQSARTTPEAPRAPRWSQWRVLTSAHTWLNSTPGPSWVQKVENPWSVTLEEWDPEREMKLGCTRQCRHSCSID